MPDHLAALNLTAEAVEVLKGSGIESLADLAGANVTYLQSTFIAAAQEGRYPEKFLSLVKIAAWVEQARTLSEQQPEGGPSTNLDNIPTAVVVAKRPQKKAYGGSGVKSAAGTMELRPDRHRRVKRDPEAAPPPAAPRGSSAPPTRASPSRSGRLALFLYHELRRLPALGVSLWRLVVPRRGALFAPDHLARSDLHSARPVAPRFRPAPPAPRPGPKLTSTLAPEISGGQCPGLWRYLAPPRSPSTESPWAAAAGTGPGCRADPPRRPGRRAQHLERRALAQRRGDLARHLRAVQDQLLERRILVEIADGILFHSPAGM